MDGAKLVADTITHILDKCDCVDWRPCRVEAFI